MIRFIANMSLALLIPLSYIACRQGLDEIRVAAGVASDSGTIIDPLGALSCVGMAVAMAVSLVPLTSNKRHRNWVCAAMTVVVLAVTWLGYFRDDLLGYYTLSVIAGRFAPFIFVWTLLVGASVGTMIRFSPLPQWAKCSASVLIPVAILISMLVLVYPLDRWLILIEARELGVSPS